MALKAPCARVGARAKPEHSILCHSDSAESVSVVQTLLAPKLFQNFLVLVIVLVGNKPTNRKRKQP